MYSIVFLMYQAIKAKYLWDKQIFMHSMTTMQHTCSYYSEIGRIRLELSDCIEN